MDEAYLFALPLSGQYQTVLLIKEDGTSEIFQSGKTDFDEREVVREENCD